ncbi:MAG: invasion associated locus B family protein [Sedimenticola selenatireducens]|jgi:invasion protein IalB|uniref:Invasion associated locus B family protein n=2 Tax=Sedimenticola selenatireducens TaxID=191960 RepID=A0A557SH25_9GAMM|nr:invasion associated locus B family protein [Sedimenticola selenatireducens]TVT64152.1 MAG: invasion associated locus B family protein [Sedimenticola selenatireducens]
MNMLQRGYAILVLVLVALLLPFPIMAEGETAEQGKIENFDNWGRRCDTPKEGGDDVCFLFQQLNIKENNQVILFITVGYPPKGTSPVMVFTTPLGVALEAGVQMQIGESGQMTKAIYKICVANGCRASLLLDEATLEAMETGETMFVAFGNAQGKGIKLAVSLKGFKAANDSLKK